MPTEFVMAHQRIWDERFIYDELLTYEELIRLAQEFCYQSHLSQTDFIFYFENNDWFLILEKPIVNQ